MVKNWLRSVCVGALFSGIVCVEAQVLTYDVAYSTTSGASLSGQFTIDTGDSGASGSSVFLAIPSWLQSISLTYSASGGGDTVLSKSDFTGLVWQHSNPIDWNADLVPQFNDINLFGDTLNGVNIFTIMHVDSGDTFTLTSMTAVPEPWEYSLVAGAGILGFGLYRRVRSRIA